MLIAAVSDTHVPGKARAVPVELLGRLKEVDMILHAGDITSRETLRLFTDIAPTEAVCGNVDDYELKQTLPRTRIIEAGGFKIGLVHGDSISGSTLTRARQAFTNVDCVVFGHSHMPYLDRSGPTLMLNPGSPTDKRRSPRPSFALIRIGETLTAEIVYL